MHVPGLGHVRFEGHEGTAQVRGMTVRVQESILAVVDEKASGTSNKDHPIGFLGDGADQRGQLIGGRSLSHTVLSLALRLGGVSVW